VLVALLLVAMATVLWIRLVPLSLDAIQPADRPQFTYQDAGGGEHVYLGGYDSYYWLRLARNVLRTGTLCDSIVDGKCHDTRRLAPTGARVDYPHSPHVFAIAGLHRLITVFDPHQPLPASAFLVSVVVAMLGVLPAFALGRHLAGALGGLFAALLVGLNPLFLVRSGNADNDVWNVVLPLFMLWAAVAALRARSAGRQVVWGAGAALLAVVHALTWRGWFFTAGVLLAGLCLEAAMVVLRAVVRSGWPPWHRTEVRRALVVLVAFAATGVGIGAATGIDASDIRTKFAGAVRFVFATSAASGPTSIDEWPSALQTVSELTDADLHAIADYMGGAPYFFAAWLGLLLIFLPRRDWQSQHFAVLVAGTCLYWYLLMFGVPGPLLLLVLLALPLGAASVLRVIGREGTEPPPRGGLVVVLWFLAALYLAFHANRYAMLLVPPFGLALGVAVGRLYGWLQPFAARLPVPERAAYAPALFVLLCLLLVPPLRLAHRNARAQVPRVSDAWWQTFERIRGETPADAVVSTWWSAGYWAEYGTERRVTADGGTPGTRVPYWLARALSAPTEEETVGLLRMLHCGSDAPPGRGALSGAYQRLLDRGVDGIAAHDMVIALARRNGEEARAYLEEQGLDDAARSNILAATHCPPPPGYLLLHSGLIRSEGWKYLSSWDFRRARVLRQLSVRPEADIVDDLVGRLGYAEESARALYRRAAALTDESARQDFVAPPLRYLGPGWVPCRRAGAEMVCPLSAADGGERIADEFAYPPEAPSAGRLRWRGRERPAPTAQILVAGAQQVEPAAVPAPTSAEIGVLVDIENERVLAGSPALLRSTFTRLVFLDGRYARALRKFDERVAYGGERLVTWEIRWE
jgi:dolichyl-diphosphooligosaccharide--protein glycosyltransferase